MRVVGKRSIATPPRGRPPVIASLIAALTGLSLIAYYGIYCRGRTLTRPEEITGLLILLAGLTAPFWLW